MISLALFNKQTWQRSAITLVNKYIHMCFSVHRSDNATEKTYIMMEARLGALFKSESEYTVLDK